jgi:hypothetical protein
MTVPGLKQIAEELDRLKIRYVVVGGGAVAQQHPVTTGDVDIMVATEAYFPTLDALDGSPKVRWAEKSPGMATVVFRIGAEEYELDVINASEFSGDQGDDAFVQYVRAKASTVIHGIRFASIPAVWYMRLTNPEWQSYVDKVARDISFGIPRAYLDEAIAIAVRFGRGAEMRERVRQVEGLLAE